MRDARNAFTLASLKRQAAAWLRSAPTAFRLTLSAALLLQSLAFLPSARAATPNTPADTNAAPATNTTKPAARPQGGAVMSPTNRGIEVAPPINLAEAARQEALGPAQAAPSEIKPVDAPKGRPDFGYRGVPIDNGYGGGKADGRVGGGGADPPLGHD